MPTPLAESLNRLDPEVGKSSTWRVHSTVDPATPELIRDHGARGSWIASMWTPDVDDIGHLVVVDGLSEDGKLL